MPVTPVFSAPAGPPARGGPAATATAAAAVTPHFSSSILARSAASRTVSFDRSSTILDKSAIDRVPYIGSNQLSLEPRLSLALVGIGLDHASQLRRGGVGELRDLGRRRHQ